MAEWYGGQRIALEYASGIAVWYASGLPPATIRWMLVRDPAGVRDPRAFLCTDTDLEPMAVLSRYVFRWRIETTFQEVREHLGVETQRQWSDLLRTTPALLGLYSLITVWTHGLAVVPGAAIRPGGCRAITASRSWTALPSCFFTAGSMMSPRPSMVAPTAAWLQGQAAGSARQRQGRRWF